MLVVAVKQYLECGAAFRKVAVQEVRYLYGICPFGE